MFFDPESSDGAAAKVDEVIRRGFVRKVYGIVAAQLLLTAAVATLFTLSDSWRVWAITSPLFSLFSLTSLGIVVLLSCAPTLRQRHPLNLYILAAFTISMAATLGQACAFVAATQNTAIVLQALITTAAATLGLVFYAFQTEYDLTLMNGFLSLGLTSLLGVSLLMVLFPVGMSFMEVGVSVLSALIFAGYIMVDTQMVSRGGYTADDYVSAALNIYVDVVDLFMTLLRLLAAKKKNDEDD